MGASAFLKSVDFTVFTVNVKTIAPMQNLYQFGHAICVCTDIMIQVTIANHVDSGYARDVHLHHPVNSYYVGFPAP